MPLERNSTFTSLAIRTLLGTTWIGEPLSHTSLVLLVAVSVMTERSSVSMLRMGAPKTWGPPKPAAIVS